MTRRLLDIRPTSLKQKTVLFVLFPTFLILVGIGGIGLQLTRQVLLDQWQETAITKLQRSAHYVDMRLMRPKQILRFLEQKGLVNLQGNELRLILEELRSLDGVVQVNYEPYEKANLPSEMGNGRGKMGKNMTHTIKQLTISPPVYNAELLSETVSLFASFRDSSGNEIGHIEVILSFYDLVDQIVKAPWWKSNKAFIVDKQGNILTSTVLFQTTESNIEKGKFGLTESLEIRTWDAMQRDTYGTIFGSGMPPGNVSGFYGLTEAPWTLVIMAPGDQVLEPILQFRNYYFFISFAGIFIAILYLRLITEKTIRAINKISKAAGDLAKGIFTEPLKVESRDEVGTLTINFNVMVAQLKERLRLQKAMDIAREVQQNLLPQKAFITEGLEVAGITLYCDETGGDYIDLLKTSHDEKKVTVVVGDVVGHGIGAALLMATVRALLRGRACRPGTIAEICNDVNRLLCKDTSYSGNFVTLFYLEIDRQNCFTRWVRCGHEPAIMYSPDKDSFSELRGDGLVLGFDAATTFDENSLTFTGENQLLLIGSDGVWDVENRDGEHFGRERIKTLMAKHHQLSAEMLIEKITEQITVFQAGQPQNDDITLAIIKTC